MDIQMKKIYLNFCVILNEKIICIYDILYKVIKNYFFKELYSVF